MTVGQTRPTVGVVVPAYNAERWVQATLESLLGQTYRDWTCVVIDDGSRDATGDIVERIAAAEPRLHVIRQANVGISRTRNIGIEALPASCELVGFLDADDLYLPHALRVLVAALQTRPDAVGAYGLADYVDELGELLKPGLHPSRQRDRREIRGRLLHSLPHQADATFATMVVGGPIWPPAVALQRLAEVKAVGCFDPDFPMQEDWDFYLRLTRRGPYVAVDEHLAAYRRHGDNLTGQHAESVFQQDRVRRTAYLSPRNTAAQRRMVARAWYYLECRQALVLAKHAALSAARGRWRFAGEAALGSLLCLSLLRRASPPEASVRRARYTRPWHVPGAQL